MDPKIFDLAMHPLEKPVKLRRETNMNRNQLYEILRESVRELAKRNDVYSPLPEIADAEASLESIGLDPLLLPDLVHELKQRFGGKDLSSVLMHQDTLHTLGDFLAALADGLKSEIAAPRMVYVDDEEENLFIFKRRFDKLFPIDYFSDPQAALEFILNCAEVTLVLTDEVMPRMTGNQLCDQVHALKPVVQFILLTGNPNNHEDLVYTTMRRNRFFEFFQKPLDIENRFEELRQLFSSLLGNPGMTK